MKNINIQILGYNTVSKVCVWDMIKKGELGENQGVLKELEKKVWIIC